ncbi:hypothetical protein NDU88_008031 [Pleurodeles waltl]|uniref:Uncharacterized protein n=1 Tax=Pleurodeles waltl TaxID=8319 RepID=A0AAV7SUQ9_PLEWA|nr:hypothetical protein NDU88_008031 [Pleurodeles waltl]
MISAVSWKTETDGEIVTFVVVHLTINGGETVHIQMGSRDQRVVSSEIRGGGPKAHKVPDKQNEQAAPWRNHARKMTVQTDGPFEQAKMATEHRALLPTNTPHNTMWRHAGHQSSLFPKGAEINDAQIHRCNQTAGDQRSTVSDAMLKSCPRCW